MAPSATPNIASPTTAPTWYKNFVSEIQLLHNKSDMQSLRLTKIEKLLSSINKQLSLNERPASSKKKVLTIKEADDPICWYHRRYGSESKKCCPPCIYAPHNTMTIPAAVVHPLPAAPSNQIQPVNMVVAQLSDSSD